jgi:hypothetical protein
MTKGEARDVRRVLRALTVVNTAARDLPEILVPAYRLDVRAAAALGTATRVLPASWRTRAIVLTSQP